MAHRVSSLKLAFETFHPRIFSLASNRSPRKGKAKEENKSYSVCLREQDCPSFSIQPTNSVYPLSEPTRRRLHFRRQVRNSVCGPDLRRIVARTHIKIIDDRASLDALLRKWLSLWFPSRTIFSRRDSDDYVDLHVLRSSHFLSLRRFFSPRSSRSE